MTIHLGISLIVLLDFANLDPTTRWLMLAAGVVTMLFAVIRPAMKKKDPLAKKSSPVSLSSQRAVERDMSNLLVELTQMARQITAQLDTRAAKLELLIREADEKLAALRSAMPRGEASPFSIVSSDRPQPPTASPRSSPVPSPTPTFSPEPEFPINDEHAQVYNLADQGKSPRQIAAQLGRPDGEIELILALRSAR